MQQTISERSTKVNSNLGLLKISILKTMETLHVFNLEKLCRYIIGNKRQSNFTKLLKLMSAPS